jgi:glycosyltransferase involved in cell wall biosynthesis
MKRCLTLFTSLPSVGGHTTITLGLCSLLRDQLDDITVLVKEMPGHGHCEAAEVELQNIGCRVLLMRGLSTSGILAQAATKWRRPDCFLSMGMRHMGPILSSLLRPKVSLNYHITHEMTHSVQSLLWFQSFFFTKTIFISPATELAWRSGRGAGRPAASITQPAEIGLKPVEAISAAAPVSFGFIGRLNEAKGSKELLEFARSGQCDAHLVVAGAGEFENNFADLSSKSGGRVSVEYLGAFASSARREFLQVFFSKIDYLIVPSQDDREGMPTVILEALQAGVPVIATRSGGTIALEFEDYMCPDQPCVRLIDQDQVIQTLGELARVARPSEPAKRACVALFRKRFSNAAIKQLWSSVFAPKQLEATEPII